MEKLSFTQFITRIYWNRVLAAYVILWVLAASDLFLMFTQSIKIYTFFRHILRSTDAGKSWFINQKGDSFHWRLRRRERTCFSLLRLLFLSLLVFWFQSHVYVMKMELKFLWRYLVSILERIIFIRHCLAEKE